MRIKTAAIVFVALALLGLVGFGFMAKQRISVERVVPAEARDRFAAVRRTFDGQEPLLVVHSDGKPGMREGADLGDGAEPAKEIHLMLYDSSNQLISGHAPIWFFALKSDAVLRFGGRADVKLDEMGLDPDDLKRLGRRLYFDGEMPEGRTMLWTE